MTKITYGEIYNQFLKDTKINKCQLINEIMKFYPNRRPGRLWAKPKEKLEELLAKLLSKKN